MFRFFESYRRSRLRDVRRALQKVAAVVQHMGSDPDRPGRRHPPSALADPLQVLWTDLSRFEAKVDKPTTDIVDSTMMFRVSFNHLKAETKTLAQDFKERYPSLDPRKSPFPPLFKRLDKLEDAILRLYGPPTKFGRELKKLIEKSDISIYRLARLSGVDETYVRRLVRGDKKNPSRGALGALALAMREYSSRVSSSDIRRLLKAAGHKPPTASELKE